MPAAPLVQGTALEARPAVGTARAMAVVLTVLAVSTVGGHRRLDHGINIVVALAGLAQTLSGVISWPRVPKVAQGAAVTAGAWSGLGYVWVASVVFRYLWGLWVPLNQPKGLRSSQEGRGHNSYIMTHLLGLQVPLL